MILSSGKKWRANLAGGGRNVKNLSDKYRERG